MWGVVILYALQVVRILLFANLQRLFRTSSIAANCELHMLVGTFLSASDNNCMEWFILSSAVKLGCVIYPCKYSAVSVIINDLVLLSIDCMKR